MCLAQAYCKLWYSTVDCITITYFSEVLTPKFSQANTLQSRHLSTLNRGYRSPTTTVSFASNGLLLTAGDSEGRLSVWSLNVRL